jgi:hypothetical protein
LKSLIVQYTIDVLPMFIYLFEGIDLTECWMSLSMLLIYIFMSLTITLRSSNSPLTLKEINLLSSNSVLVLLQHSITLRALYNGMLNIIDYELLIVINEPQRNLSVSTWEYESEPLNYYSIIWNINNMKISINCMRIIVQGLCF